MPDGATAFYEKQSATLLSQQPLTPRNLIQAEDKDWGVAYQHFERRLAGMRSWRWTWIDQWRELAAYFLPRRMKWLYQPVANNYNRGQYLNGTIIDSTGVLAMGKCASGMWSGLTNPARPWFEFGPAIEMPNLDEESKAWLVDLKQKVHVVLGGSNFYDIMAQMFQDVTVFGTSPVILYEDQEDVIRLYLPCAGEYFLGAGSRLTVDTLYREFTMTVLQIVEMFGMKNLPPDVWRLFEMGGGSLDVEFVVAHAIEPNIPIANGRGKPIHPISDRFTYREFYWLRGRRNQKPLSKRGFNEKPFMVSRWWLVSNDPYGRSPCMDALGDNKQIQTETMRKAEFLEKGVRPPMTADPSMKNEPASIMPGMVTFVNTANGSAGFKPAFEVQAQWLQFMTADIKDVQLRIQECLYVPQFMAITQMQGVQPRNELELTKRDLERLQVLGPVITNFENEVGPMIQRTVGIMQRRGLVKPIPAGLQRVPLKINYMSLMRLAQRAAESIAMKDGFVTLGELSAAAKTAGLPDPLRVVNLDKSAKHYLYLNSYPIDCVYSDDEVKQHDQIRAQEIERAKQEAAASNLSKPAVDAAKVLSQTEVNGGSYLSSLLSGNVTPS